MSEKSTTGVTRKPLGVSNKKPLVLSSGKFKKILSTVHGDETKKNETEEEQHYRDYLKKGSDEIVSKWKGHLKRTQEHKQEERKQKIEEKAQKEKQEFLKIREKDERIRKEKIAKAEELIQKLKPGPKELQSAAIQSETLKGRAIQRDIAKEFEKAQNKRTAEEQFQLESQAMPWIEEEQNRISNSMRRINEYKTELLSTINDKFHKKTERRKRDLAAEKSALNVFDQEIKAQIAKEQEALKRKRETLRKNALEAMIMVEQRKARDQVQDMVEEKLISVFNDGKAKIEKIKKTREMQAREDLNLRITSNAKQWAATQVDPRPIDEEKLRKDISKIHLQFTAEEQERKERSRQQKNARILEFFREQNAQKEKKQREIEETRLALANRLKNEEVNAAFKQQQKLEKLEVAKEITKVLAEQVEDRKQTEAREKEYDRKCCTVSFAKEDKFFFDYADNLVADAIKKDRPLYPFVRAVNQYKKENCIDLERKLPPHLESHLRIGVKTPAPDECGDESQRLTAGTLIKYGLAELKKMNPYSP